MTERASRHGSWWSSALLLLAYEFHGGQRARVRNALVARRESVCLKHVGNDVEDVALAEAPGGILGHRGLDTGEERTHVLVLPLREERIAPELRPHRASVVARRALGVVRRAAPLCLLLVVDAVAHRRLRAARRLTGRGRNNGRREGARDQEPPKDHGRPSATHSAGSSFPPMGTT